MSRPARISSLGVTLEERCGTAFDEYARGGALKEGNFDAAFRRAGFPDAKVEEVERYHQNFMQQRQGVAGTVLRQDEFLRILSAHDQKRRFLETTRISAKEWVCNALRSLSYLFTKCTLHKGECLWTINGTENKTMGIIIKGRAMLWGRQANGLVDFPVCELGVNAILGDGLMPNNASKVVAMGETDVLFIPMSEVKLRLGDRFLEEMSASLVVKNRHVEARLDNMQRVCKRAMSEPPLAQLPFLPVKNQNKEQLAQGMQKLASAQSQKRSALQAANRAILQAANQAATQDGDQTDNHLSTLAAEQSRIFRMERSGRILGTSTESRSSFGKRARTSISRGQVRSRIPRRIQSSEFHVCIDTGSMMYDDLR